MKTGKGLPVFSGVAIGPAVVYRKAHPEAKLVPVNMNDSVLGMYNHVLNSDKQ